MYFRVTSQLRGSVCGEKVQNFYAVPHRCQYYAKTNSSTSAQLFPLIVMYWNLCTQIYMYIYILIFFLNDSEWITNILLFVGLYMDACAVAILY